jgi:hypothetical protein
MSIICKDNEAEKLQVEKHIMLIKLKKNYLKIRKNLKEIKLMYGIFLAENKFIYR